MDAAIETYREKIGYPRGSLWAPFHAVGMVVRLQGEVPPELVQAALGKLQVLYPPLASRVELAPDGSAWLTPASADPLVLDVRPRRADGDWAPLFLEQERRPFSFERGPLARFFLLRGAGCTDLVAIAPHVICDGGAMALVVEDAVALVNDPARPVCQPPPPPPVTWESVDHAPGDHRALRRLIHLANIAWPNHRPAIDQAAYERVHRQYWAARQDGLLAFALPPTETDRLLARCRQHGVSLTGALAAAFVLAQDGALPALQDVTVAANIRSRLRQPPGRVMGVFASNINLVLRPRPGGSVWELARQAHTRLHAALEDPARLLWPLAIGELHPSISDALLAALSTGQLSRRLGPLKRWIKIGGMSPNLDVSNIGRLDLPAAGGGPFPLETILPLPPLWPGGGLAVNVLTVNGRMNVVLKHRLDQLPPAALPALRDRVLELLGH